MNLRGFCVVKALTTCASCVLPAGITACANEPGDTVDCPVCDNATELLVGSKCAPVAEVARCGPDGDAHGDVCHCFSNQEPTTIGGVDYCLQQGCASGDQVVDVDEAACEHLTDTPEAVTAVEAFADFEEAHVDLNTLAEVALPAGASGYIHFPVMNNGHVLAYLDTAGVFAGAWDASQQPLVVESLGANSDCQSDLVDAWEIHVVNDTGSIAPQIIELAASAASSVRIVLMREQE